MTCVLTTSACRVHVFQKISHVGGGGGNTVWNFHPFALLLWFEDGDSGYGAFFVSVFLAV